VDLCFRFGRGGVLCCLRRGGEERGGVLGGVSADELLRILTKSSDNFNGPVGGKGE